MRIAIVEDEPAAARQLKKMLERARGLEAESLAICGSLGEAREAARRGLDLLFLDINLMGESGFGVFDEEYEQPFQTIITTAYPEHALHAFERGALDYLVKPFSQERLEKALDRVRKTRPGERPGLRRIVVKDRGEIIPVNVDDITLIRSAGDYCELFLKDGARTLCSKRMDYLEKSLPEDFMRIHRTAIVRLSEVTGLRAAGGGRYLAIVGEAQEPVPVGRKYRRRLREKLGE
ncbi:MAG: LytR/AlgR family response regulator transcription factor [Candidatus Nitrospinota bacterium M3_3B_026]